MKYNTLICPAELAGLLEESPESVLIFDVTSSIADPELGKKLYPEGHIPGAVFLDFDSLTGAVAKGTGRHPLPDLVQFIQTLGDHGFSGEKQVVLYDQGGVGFASRIWYQLRWAGFNNVCVLNGGLKGWKANGLPLSAETPQIKLCERGVKKALEKPVEMAEVQEVVKNGDKLIIDARPEGRFHGQGETIDHKAGHIPGSISRSGSLNLDKDGYFKKPEELREEFLELLAGRDPKEVIHSCGSGVNATVNLLAMDYCGLKGSRLYPGSWSQWIDFEENPIQVP